jgi:hypothetical protein
MINDFRGAVIIRFEKSQSYHIMSVACMHTLVATDFRVISMTEGRGKHNTIPFSSIVHLISDQKVVPRAEPPVETPQIRKNRVTKAHIRRPRNQFIIYRQWMSHKLHAKNPGLTAGEICKIPV